MKECNLYLISPSKLVLADFLPELKEALSVGIVKAFQLRLKDATDDDIIQAAQAIKPICQDYEVAFILNDRPDLVANLDLNGVHLGQDDMKISEARKIIGTEKIIGASCHATKHLGFEAGEAGADYVAFGAFFPTKSKPAEKIARFGVPDIELIKWWAEYTEIPSVAIGGMTADNCGELVRAGADFIAAITAVWEHKLGTKEAVEEFAKAIENARKINE